MFRVSGLPPALVSVRWQRESAGPMSTADWVAVGVLLLVLLAAPFLYDWAVLVGVTE